MHQRLKPQKYGFNYPTFMFYVDLDEIDSICRETPWVSHDHFNLYSFNDSDHLNTNPQGVKASILDYLKAQGLDAPVERIMLLTNLRTFGHVFNPVSFYFCYNKEDLPVALIAEVNNTFGETKLFYLGPDKLDQNQFLDQQDKFFYISPFAELDVSLGFEVKLPGDSIHLVINDYAPDGERIFFASLDGKSEKLNSWNVFKSFIQFPFVTLQIITLIHWHAFRLFLKKVPFHKKSANPHLQQKILSKTSKHQEI